MPTKRAAVPVTEASTLIEALATWVAATPDAVAIRSGDESVSFRELHRRAAAIASRMKTCAGGVVPILAERGVAASVAVVAVLLRGAAWLCVDSSLPPQRVSHLLKESSAVEALVSPERHAAAKAALELMECDGLPLVDLSPPAGAEDNAAAPVSLPSSPSSPDSFAYMIFTSGSTGHPKAVKITHRQLLDMCFAFITQWGCEMHTGDVGLAQIAYAWDMHVLDLWLPLVQGAAVHVLSEEERLDSARVAAAMADVCPSWCQGTPTFWRLLMAEGWQGTGCERLVAITSGEPLAPDLARELLLRVKSLVNCYGVTEATIFQSFDAITLPDDPNAPVDVSCGLGAYAKGDDDRCTVLLCRRETDGDNPKLSVIHERESVGEIWFAGSCLPLGGYVNAPELNAAKFASNPTGWVCESADDSIRRTKVLFSGDVGMRRASDGKLVVLGRTDSVVKVLGSRVDLFEVRHALCELRELVTEAAVVDVKDSAGQTQLVGYFVPSVRANEMAVAVSDEEHEEETLLWEAIYNEAYAKKDAVGMAVDGGAATTSIDPSLSAEDLVTNWSGYISSYTGKLWPRSVIEHWVNATLDRFLDVAPVRVLEHGCGNGMLSFRAALQPAVEEVYMCDLSGEACEYLRAVADSPHFESIRHKLRVLHRPMNNFDEIPADYFDVVVISAAIMYAPSMEYVCEVLRKASRALRDGGVVYIGDCRSLEHMEHFHTDVTLHNADDEMSAAAYVAACNKRQAEEKELLISPEFFYSHAQLLPGLYKEAACVMRRGYDCPKLGEPGADARHADAPVEMTRWRYDVFMYKSARAETESPEENASAPLELVLTGAATIDEARKRAREERRSVLVRGVPNANVLAAVASQEVAAAVAREGSDKTFADVRAAIGARVADLAVVTGGKGIVPEAVVEATESAGGVMVQIMFSPTELHSFDCLFYPIDAAESLRPPRFRNGPLHTQVDYGRRVAVGPVELGKLLGRGRGVPLFIEAYGNKRRWGAVTRAMYTNLRSSLASYMVPVSLVAVDSLPVGPTGKLDKRRLPMVDVDTWTRERRTTFRPPSTATESTLVEMFKRLFFDAAGDERPTGDADGAVGVDDDFADLGGNSLSAGRLINLCKRELDVDLTMAVVFESRTPAKLAAHIDTICAKRSPEACRGGSPPLKTAPSTPKSGTWSPSVVAQRSTAQVPILVEDIFIPVPRTPGDAAADGGATIQLHARVWRPDTASMSTTLPLSPAIVHFAPYPASYMTTTMDSLTYGPLAMRGSCCVRVQARGFDDSEGACADPYEITQVHVKDFAAAVEWLAKLPYSNGRVALHGFSWAGTAALRLASSPGCPPEVCCVCSCGGNDSLFENDVFFEGSVPLAYNYTWATQFQMYAGRPPTSLNGDWQGAWKERIEASQHLSAKYLSRNDADHPFWRAQTMASGGYDTLKLPVLCCAGYLGRYADAVHRLYERCSDKVEVRGLIGPWPHQFPHISPIGPTVDWIEEVHSFVAKYSAPSAAAAPQDSTLTYFVCDSFPLGPSIPSEFPGSYVRSSRGDAGAGGLTPQLLLHAAADGRLLRGEAPSPADGTSFVIPDTVVGLGCGEWFSWGIAADAPEQQLGDDEKSLCFDWCRDQVGGEGGTVYVAGRPTVVLHLAAPPPPDSMVCARLCIVKANGTVESARASMGVVSCARASGVTLTVELHFTAFNLHEGDVLRLALSTSYFPMFLTLPAGEIALASVELRLPQIVSTPVSLPPPSDDFSRFSNAVRRLRAVNYVRRIDSNGVFTLLDDGTISLPSGLTTSTSGRITVHLVNDEIHAAVDFESTCARGGEFARVRMKSTFVTSKNSAGGRKARVKTQQTAIANGKTVVQVNYDDVVLRLMGLATDAGVDVDARA